MPLPDFSPLPELGRRSDDVAAILIVDDAVLFLRDIGHGGTYLKLPGGRHDPNEALEVSCRKRALEQLRKASREWGRQLHIDLHEDEIDLEIGDKVGEHAVGRLGRAHYFLATGSSQRALSGPSAQPQVDAGRLVWQPYVWVPISDLHSVSLRPDDVVAICVEAGKRRANQRVDPTSVPAHRNSESHSQD